MPSSGRNDFLQTVYERYMVRSGVAVFVLCMHGDTKVYNVYVYGMNAEYIERVRCGSRYIVYNFDANGACMVGKKRKVWNLEGFGLRER